MGPGASALGARDSALKGKATFGGGSTESGVAGVPIAKRNSEDRLSPHFLTYTICIFCGGLEAAATGVSRRSGGVYEAKQVLKETPHNRVVQ